MCKLFDLVYQFCLAELIYSNHHNKKIDMKNLLFYLLLVLTSCTSDKTIFDDSNIGLPEHAKKILLEKLGGENSDKSVVVFTARFDNDTIKIINNKEVVFEERVETEPIARICNPCN